MESAQRRSISSSTCFTDKISKNLSNRNEELNDSELGHVDLNRFLKEQRIKIQRLMKGEIKAKAKIVLSGHSNSKFTFEKVTGKCRRNYRFHHIFLKVTLNIICV